MSAVAIRLELALGAFELECALELDSKSVGIFGPSGAGKTSLLEAVAGWRRPRAGRVAVGGRVLFDSAAGVDLPPGARGVGYVPQEGLLFPHWDVRRNVRAGRGRGGGEELFERALDVLELRPLLARGVATLSGGERQRVALARALCSAPELLLFDEPLGGLDLPLRRRILPYLVRVREAFDVPLLFVSHDPTEVQAVCDHVVVLAQGRVTAEGAPLAVLGGPGVGGTDFENVLRGEVATSGEATAELCVPPGLRVQVPLRGLREGDTALFGLRADDILISVAPEPPRGLSARNVLPARVVRLDARGADVVLCAVPLSAAGPGPELLVGLTPGAVRELELAPGRAVHLVFKTQSCHLLTVV